jgi:chemotaxis protein MotB
MARNMARGRNKGEGVTLVIKKIEEGGHGHHGGAWKVAYADFVTAMMAFFLLMWLLNATTEEQRRGIADFFAPTSVLGRNSTGSGLPFGGRTPHEEGDMASNTGAIRIEQGPKPILTDIEEEEAEQVAQPVPRREAPQGPEEVDPRRIRPTPEEAPPGEVFAVNPTAPDPQRISEEALRAEVARRDEERLQQIAEQLREAVRNDPALAALGPQFLVEQTREGVRIQLLDAERQPMFALGGAAPNDRTRALIARVGQVINQVPYAISIAGHTDATPFRGAGRTNWDLSADRANTTRRLLAESGVAETRFRSVAGYADRDPLLPEDPVAAGNRRVAITLLRPDARPTP